MFNDNQNSFYKQCAVCLEKFPANTDYFNKRRASPDGLNRRCRTCNAAIQRGHLVVIPTRVNGEKLCRQCKSYYPATTEYFYKNHNNIDGLYSKCKECSKDKRKKHYAENEAKEKEQMREYRRKNRKTLYEKAKLRRDPEKFREYQATYRSKNREKVLLSRRRWEHGNYEYGRAKLLKRRARLKELPSDFSVDDYLRMMKYWGHRCALTGLQDDIHIDHWIPITSPDCPGTIPTNMLPLNATLNLSKGAKNPEEWLIETFGREKAVEIKKHIQAYFEWVASET